MAANLLLLRCADYCAAPWKNGGGVTHEVLRVPPDAPQFDWRVSIAQIDRPGPFSDFHGYTRHMALLAGNGVRLRFAGSAQELRRPGDLIEFDGGDAVTCELLDGSCTDLNLMVINSLPARVQLVSVAQHLAAPAPGEQAFLLALTPLVVAHEDGSVSLGPWDAVRWQTGAAQLAPAEEGAPSVAFFATIGHGRPFPAARSGS